MKKYRQKRNSDFEFYSYNMSTLKKIQFEDKSFKKLVCFWAQFSFAILTPVLSS